MKKGENFEIELAEETSYKHDEDAQSDISDSHSDEKKDDSSAVIKKLITVCIVCLTFMTVEIIGGVIANSIAILSDAVHLLTDLSGFIISIVSLRIAKRAPTKVYTYGYQRAGIIGALLNVITIWVLVGLLMWEAVERIITNDLEVEGNVMFYTACFGLFCNLVMVKVLHGQDGHHHHGCSHSHGHHHHVHMHDHGHSHGHGYSHSHGSCSHDHHSHDHKHKHSHKEEDEEHHHDHKHNHKDSEDHKHDHEHGNHIHKEESDFPLQDGNNR